VKSSDRFVNSDGLLFSVLNRFVAFVVETIEVHEMIATSDRLPLLYDALFRHKRGTEW